MKKRGVVLSFSSVKGMYYIVDEPYWFCYFHDEYSVGLIFSFSSLSFIKKSI